MNRLNEVDTRSRMIQMMERLPIFLQNKWRSAAVGTMEATGIYPNIEAFANFIDRMAREASDPVFGIMNQRVSPANRDLKQHGPTRHTKSSGQTATRLS